MSAFLHSLPMILVSHLLVAVGLLVVAGFPNLPTTQLEYALVIAFAPPAHREKYAPLQPKSPIAVQFLLLLHAVEASVKDLNTVRVACDVHLLLAFVVHPAGNVYFVAFVFVWLP